MHKIYSNSFDKNVKCKKSLRKKSSKCHIHMDNNISQTNNSRISILPHVLGCKCNDRCKVANRLCKNI